LKSKHGIVGWRAWYSKGRTYNSAEVEWEDLPADGVLVILLYCRERNRSRRLSGRSLYWREPTEDGFIYGHDDAADAILPEGAERKGWLKRGKYVTEEEYAWAENQANEFQNSAPDESLRVDRG
jgi:hypothetical protein